MATLMCAVFEDTQSAEQALRALEAGGFPRQQMEMRSGDELMHQTQPQRAGRGNQRAWDRVRGLFENRGSSDRRSAATAEAAPDTESSAIDDNEIVLVLTADDDQIGQAAEILGDSGALNLDERLGDATEGESRDEPVYAVVIEEVAIEAAPIPGTAAQDAQGQAQPGAQPASAGEQTASNAEQPSEQGQSASQPRSRPASEPGAQAAKDKAAEQQTSGDGQKSGSGEGRGNRPSA